MYKCAPPEWSSNNAGKQRGVTLMELMVTLVILSILAAAALPYAEISTRRSHELELRRALRDVRSAIDRFHDDWLTGKISKLNDATSEDGYPKTLQVLVEGVETAQAKDGKMKYLRRIPADPLGDKTKPVEQQWILRGYQDEPNTMTWNGKDVFDIRTTSDKKGLDGSRYQDW